MKPGKLVIVPILVLSCLAANSYSAQELTDYVHPFMGVVARGNTVLGPQRPWGSINPSPDTKDGYTDGYNIHRKIRGFSQLHVTGTGGPGKYGQFLISPQIGLNVAEDGHDSAKSDERATVSSYRVRLTDYNILCELTPTRHAAIYRFTFPKSDNANIDVDLGHNIPADSTHFKAGYADAGEVFVDPSRRLIKGWGEYWGGWSGRSFRVYFAAHYSQPATRYGTWKNGRIATGSKYQKVDKNKDRIGACLKFSTETNEPILFKIAVSFSSMDKAREYLDAEIPGWDFDRVRREANAAWNDELKKIRIEGVPEQEEAVFYSCLYNTMRMPRDRTGDNPAWDSTAPYWDDHYCVWDTWKTDFPLQVLINESMVRDNLQAFIDRFKHNGEVMDAFIAGNDRYYQWQAGDMSGWMGNQGGDNPGNVIADAYMKKVKGVDWEAAYQVVKSSADCGRAPSYRAGDRGWVPYRSYAFGLYCSRTLEFAYNDFCAAEMAKGLGHRQDYERYLKRSRGWENLWNPAADSDGYKGFIAPRWMNGDWVPYDPKRDRAVASPGGIDRSFYEGSSWIYSYFVPHDYARLIELSGGSPAYCDKLQHALEHHLIDFGNEPSFITPFSFIYAGRPDLASRWVRQNIRNYNIDGFPGDEDSGAMGSWYVFAVLGLFPNAGQDVYLLNGPMYPKATITREDGSRIVIEGINASPDNVYVQSLTLDGKPWNKAWITHEEIAKGAVLRFVMGPNPSDWGKDAPPPPSLPNP